MRPLSSGGEGYKDGMSSLRGVGPGAAIGGGGLRGAALASTAEQLREAVARACPRPCDKWVVKSPQGFAARGRVLGRGPVLGEPQARWAERRMASGETLIFQP